MKTIEEPTLAESLILCDTCGQPVHGDLTGSAAGLTHPWCAADFPRPDEETSCAACGDTVVFGDVNDVYAPPAWCGFWPDAVMCDGCDLDEMPRSPMCEHGNSLSVCPYDHRDAAQ